MDTQSQDVSRLRPGAIAAGAVLLILGAGMFLDTTGVTDIRMGRVLGPLILIGIGASTLDRRRNPANGLWLIGLGVWIMASQIHLFGLTFATSWPFLIILTGLMIVIRGMR